MKVTKYKPSALKGYYEPIDENASEDEPKVVSMPNLEQFGITQEQIEEIKRRQERVKHVEESAGVKSLPIVMLLCGLLLPIYMLISSKLGVLSLLLYFVAGIGMGMFVWLPVAILIMFVTGVWEMMYLDSSLERRVSDYDAAVKSYEKYVKRMRSERLRAMRSFWDMLDGKAFEQELAALYKKLGFKAHLMPEGGDGGVDIVLEKDGKTTIVQCKAHKSPVGPHVVRDLYGTLIHFGASEAILASVSGFTSGVKSYVDGKPIKLLGLDEIIEMQMLVVSKYDT